MHCARMQCHKSGCRNLLSMDLRPHILRLDLRTINFSFMPTYVYGGERYHFCMVQFYDDRRNNVRTCPARIMSFVQFKTKTFPVPDDATNALYAIVHTAREYLSWQEIEKSFVSPFILGDMKSCVYIVNTNNISDPLFVCPNYGQDGSHFLCCLPYRRWGSYFRYQLNRT